MNVVLGSQSPRRKEILEHLLPSFEVRGIDINEDYSNDISPQNVPEFLAKKKFEAYATSLAEELIICADTVVLLDEFILEKPSNKSEAFRMLQSLSGRTHKVITGVCMGTRKRQHCFSSETLVTFVSLSDTEIRNYIDKFYPMDKAGSYGIQEWVGIAAVERIEGCYYNVMGLPSSKVYQGLKDFGVL
jgi:septum formation protein